MKTPLLVLGLGNVLCADDGAGIACVQRLIDEYAPPEGVRVLDGGTLGLSLLPLLRDAVRVILVDAVAADRAPGTVVCFTGDEVAHAAVRRLSVHQVGVADLLDGTRLLGGGPEEIVLVGIVPESLELTLELTPAVAAGLPELERRVLEEAARLGFADWRPRAQAALRDPRDRAARRGRV